MRIPRLQVRVQTASSPHAQDSARGEVHGGEGGKAACSGQAAGAAGAPGRQLAEAAKVTFLTAALMGVALCFHSVLEVRVS